LRRQRGKDKKGDPVVELRTKLDKLNKEKALLEENIRKVAADLEKVDPLLLAKT